MGVCNPEELSGRVEAQWGLNWRMQEVPERLAVDAIPFFRPVQVLRIFPQLAGKPTRSRDVGSVFDIRRGLRSSNQDLHCDTHYLLP
jgi:hypothetical protein